MRISFPLMAVTFALEVVAECEPISALPLSAYADTEAVTNVAFNAGDSDDRLFRLSLELNATADNNVSILFGTDANENGVLEVLDRGLNVILR